MTGGYKMNTRRKWDSKTKATIILEGLKGRSVADICTEHNISQAQYYKWRDVFLANISQPFEVSSTTKQEERLERENKKLRQVIGDLTVELKKTTGKIHQKNRQKTTP